MGAGHLEEPGGLRDIDRVGGIVAIRGESPNRKFCRVHCLLPLADSTESPSATPICGARLVEARIGG